MKNLRSVAVGSILAVFGCAAISLGFSAWTFITPISNDSAEPISSLYSVEFYRSLGSSIISSVSGLEIDSRFDLPALSDEGFEGWHVYDETNAINEDVLFSSVSSVTDILGAFRSSDDSTALPSNRAFKLYASISTSDVAYFQMNYLDNGDIGVEAQAITFEYPTSGKLYVFDMVKLDWIEYIDSVRLTSTTLVNTFQKAHFNEFAQKTTSLTCGLNDYFDLSELTASAADNRYIFQVNWAD